MAGVGKILKQAQKMQRQMEKIQQDLAEKELDFTSGGGAVKIVINGQGEFKKLELDPDFLKEDPEFVQETLLAAVQEAATGAKAVNEAAMGEATSGFAIPGLM